MYGNIANLLKKKQFRLLFELALNILSINSYRQCSLLRRCCVCDNLNPVMQIWSRSGESGLKEVVFRYVLETESESE